MSMDELSGVPSLIGRWREYALARGVESQQVDLAEASLREDSETLRLAGLDAQEAFLISLRRLAETDAPTREFAREFSGELWAPAAELVTAPMSEPELKSESESPGDSPAESPAASSEVPERSAKTDFWVMLACAAGAAAAVKAPNLFGLDLGNSGEFFARNLSLFVLPFLAIYFFWKHGLNKKLLAALVVVFAVGAVAVNAYPFISNGSTGVLSAIHLPIALWLVTGLAYVGGDWLSSPRRMDYVRFTGEWLVNYALIAMGGGVLVGVTVGVFSAIGVDVESLITEWILPCGAAGAVIVSAWLADTRRNFVGGMAPMLARVFTPLFAVMLAALLVGVISTRGVINIERDVLILFDLLLVLVLALLLYAVSARDPLSKPGSFDAIQLVLVVCALGVDVFALVNIAARLTEFGFSANRTAAIGLNLILLVNLAWSAFLQVGFLRSRRGFESVERWHMRYLPVYALWAMFVVIAFAPLFHFA